MPSVKKENQIIIKKGSYPRENELTPIDDENELPELEPELVIPFWVAMMSYEHPSPIGRITSYNVCYTKLLRCRTVGNHNMWSTMAYLVNPTLICTDKQWKNGSQ